MEEILETMIENLSINFIKIVIENPAEAEKKIYSKEDRVDFRIHCNYWKAETLKALCARRWEWQLLSTSNLSNWFLKYAHTLCEYSMRQRPTLAFIHKLKQFRPRESFLRTLLSKKKINSDLYSVYLNAENLHRNLGVLLEIEDIDTLREFVPLIQRDVELDFSDERCFETALKKETIAKIKEIVTPKLDEVVVVDKSREHEYDLTEILVPDTSDSELPFGTVQKYGVQHINFKLDLKCELVENSHFCDLVFRPSRISIRYQQNALQHLNASESMKNYLSPGRYRESTSTIDELTLELVNTGIANNPEQLAAVTNIVTGPNSYAPFIIFGPPGTGKTTTIVEAMIQLRLQRPESRILVAAGSNDACDTIAIRLCEIFNNNERVQQHLANETMLPMLRIYSRSILARGTRNICDALRRRSNLKWFGLPSIESIHRYGIVLATLCTVGTLVRGDVGKKIKGDGSDRSESSGSDHFTHVFIDEAAASSEPEALIGIMGIKSGADEHSCRVILSGDHKQLGAVIKSDVAKKLGLDKSLMERLLECRSYAVNGNGDYDRTLQVRLRRNYRSHPEIVSLYNHLYYNGELIAMKTATENENKPPVKWPFLPNSAFPIAFQVVRGSMRKDGTHSSCNMLEVKVLCVYIRRLLRAAQVEQSDIGVITPYKLQCERIKDRFKERRWTRIEVGSVENFQGREKPIIIASMVRSGNCLGFLRCTRRLNVLLSRPKSLLIILGEPKTLSGSKDLKFIINQCQINGNYLEKNQIKSGNDNEKPQFNCQKSKLKDEAKKSTLAEKQAKLVQINKDVKIEGSVATKTKKTKLLNLSNSKRGFLERQIILKAFIKGKIKAQKNEKVEKDVPKRRTSI